MKEVTLSLQGENSPFRKIVTLLKLLFCEICFNTVQEIRRGQNFGVIVICNVWMYFFDTKEVTLSPQGENSPFRKIVTLITTLRNE